MVFSFVESGGHRRRGKIHLRRIDRRRIDRLRIARSGIDGLSQLAAGEPVEDPAAGHQLVKSARLDDATAVEHIDAIGLAYRR